MAVQKQLRGIREFLGSFQRETDTFFPNPVVSPVFDIAPFLQEPEFVRASGNITVLGATVTAEVPDGEIWRVAGVFSSLVLVGGDFAALQPVYIDRSVAFVLSSPQMFSTGTATGPGTNVGQGVLTPGLTLFPGQEIGVQAIIKTGASTPVASVQALVTKIQI